MFEKDYSITVYIADTPKVVVSFNIKTSLVRRVNNHTLNVGGDIVTFADDCYVDFIVKD